MANKAIHFRQETPLPAHGHDKGKNAYGYHPGVNTPDSPSLMLGSKHSTGGSATPITFGGK